MLLLPALNAMIDITTTQLMTPGNGRFGGFIG
jgi:hypothetical protein